MAYKNGDLYVGEWLNGLKHGKGRFVQKDGYTYDGFWKEELYQGKGT